MTQRQLNKQVPDGFLMHCGAKMATVNELEAVPVGPGSATYQPIAHAVFRNTVMDAIRERNLVVSREHWALSTKDYASGDPTVYSGPGARMFGIIGLVGKHDDREAFLGLRNSTDKTIKIGFAIGHRIFICDNLALSGNYVVFKRHTSRLDLTHEVNTGMDNALDGLRDWDHFVERMGNTACPNHKFDRVIAGLIQGQALPGKTAYEMLRAWYDQKAPDDRPDLQQRLTLAPYNDGTAWSVHNLWTDLVGRRQNLVAPGGTTLRRHSVLNRTIETHLL